jgi:hypothetical protein
MTREEYLKFCSVCKNRSFNPRQGIICSLTNEIAAFKTACPDFIEDEREVELANEKVVEQKQQTKKGINKGRYALFLVAGLYAVVGFFEAFVIEGHELIFGLIDWGIAAVFIGLAIWSYWKPTLSLIIGLGFYVALILLIAAFEPSSLFQGIIWKVIVIVALIQGIRTAREEAKKMVVESADLLDQF